MKLIFLLLSCLVLVSYKSDNEYDRERCDVQLLCAIVTGKSHIKDYCTKNVMVTTISSRDTQKEFVKSKDLDYKLYSMFGRGRSIMFQNYIFHNDTSYTFEIVYNFGNWTEHICFLKLGHKKQSITSLIFNRKEIKSASN